MLISFFGRFMKRAFSDMKESAIEQHEIDRAEFNAVRTESKAHFEEHRGRNTLAAARSSSAEKRSAAKAAKKARLDEANERINAANERIEAAKIAR